MNIPASYSRDNFYALSKFLSNLYAYYIFPIFVFNYFSIITTALFSMLPIFLNDRYSSYLNIFKYFFLKNSVNDVSTFKYFF